MAQFIARLSQKVKCLPHDFYIVNPLAIDTLHIHRIPCSLEG